jgi:hypothetical protein
MSAQVSNLALVGSAARLSRALAAAGSARQQVDSLEGSGAAPPRDQATQYDAYDRYDPGTRPRGYGFVRDHVVSFGGVLVSHEVGATMMQTQALNGTFVLPPADAERQIAHYEFAQSLMGPPEVMPAASPFVQPMQ